MKKRVSSVLVACLLLSIGLGRAEAAEIHRLAVSGGALSALDLEEVEVNGTAWQLSYGLRLDEDAWLRLRAGRMWFDRDLALNSRTDVEIDYVTAAGEYILERPAWDSGFFFGLGHYQMQGDTLFGESSDSELGVTFGTTAAFSMTRRLGVLLELAGHYGDFPDDQFFGVLSAGLSWSF